jgi:hypothetical protein
MAKPRRMSAVDRTGKRYGRLTVLSRFDNLETPNGPVTRWLCRCDCGTETVVRGPGLAKAEKGKGGTKSCGCLNREKPIKHGMAASPLYRTWNSMVQRCTNPNNTHYASYGERGIGVCDRWRDFANFYADMGDQPKGMTIDRTDNNRGYEPGNCRWVTRKVQGNNRRTNVVLPFRGEKRTIAEWAEVTGLGKSCLNNRLAKGWSPEKALSTPKMPRSNSTQKGK